MIVLASGHDAPPFPTQAGVLSGLVWAFRVDPEGWAEEIPVDRPIELDCEEGTWLWLHFNLSDTRACRWIAGVAELPPVSRTLLTALNDHQQFHAAEGCVFGAIADLVRDLDRDTDRTAFLNFAMSDKLVITGRRLSLQSVDETRAALRAGRRLTGPAGLIEMIVENIASGIAKLTDALAEELDDIEDMVLTDALHDERRRLGRMRRTAVHLHRQLLGLRALFNRFRRSEEAGPLLAPAMTRLLQILEGLDQEVLTLQERARLLQEEISSKLAEESNRSLHTLTVLTALFLPPTLIAGIFGMNTGGLPFESTPFGSFWAFVLGVASAGAVFWFLRRAGIIRR